MASNDKIPIIVGVTGHRNIVEEDKPLLSAKVKDSLTEIRNLCKGKDGEETPVIMLNAFAQGADMLCAEAAFDLGIAVYAVLPCKEEKYKQSFDLHTGLFNKAGITSGKEYEEAIAKDEADKEKLDEYLSRVRAQGGRIIYAPDIERNKAWIKKSDNIDDESYEYRQLGIYIAEHSHVLLALWDGKQPKGKYGCGTVEVLQFALEHKFLDQDKLFKPGTINDSAVVWIKSRRQGDGAQADVVKKWLISGLEGSEGEKYGPYVLLEKPPAFLNDILLKTMAYNAEKVHIKKDKIKKGKTGKEKAVLWKNVDELDDYRKNLRLHYEKADGISYGNNQGKYNLFLLLLAIVGTVVACTFLIYDDASLPYMIFPCTLAIGTVIWLSVRGRRKAYHKKYIEYRAFAEALRIQFYMSMCLNEAPSVVSACDLYAWSQKVDMVWAEKAIRALSVISDCKKLKVDPSEVVEVWLGDKADPKGQLEYHNRKKAINQKKSETFEKLSKGFKTVTIAVYFLIFTFEVVTYVLKACGVSWFWDGNFAGHLTWRNFAGIMLGTVTAGSLLASSYWGKLSYDRKVDDNIKMSEFYASALERWHEVKQHTPEIERYVKEIAREEIVENGIWCSYVNENGLEINI